MKEGYLTALICLKGHVITTRLELEPYMAAKFCHRCGAATISQCQHCRANIPGDYHIDNPTGYGNRGPDFIFPQFCRGCGEPFPWTETTIQELKLMVQEVEGLTEEQEQQLSQDIDDLVKPTPRTERAIQHIKALSKTVGKATWTVIEKGLVKIATDYVKGQLGLP